MILLGQLGFSIGKGVHDVCNVFFKVMIVDLTSFMDQIFVKSYENFYTLYCQAGNVVHNVCAVSFKTTIVDLTSFMV